MKDQELLEQITLNPKIMAGKPIIQGTRLTVEYVLNLLAHGATTEEILAEYQGLKPEDIQACYLFAAKSKNDEEITASSSGLESEAFVGMWRDRDDMRDSSEWVRKLRRQCRLAPLAPKP